MEQQGVGAEDIAAVRTFFVEWETDWESLRASYGRFFTPDCVWENAGFPTFRGPEEAVAVMVDPARETLDLEIIRVEIKRIAWSEGIVWSERVDTLVNRDGVDLVTVPLVGVMEMAPGGRVSHWREYFDPRPMLGDADQ